MGQSSQNGAFRRRLNFVSRSRRIIFSSISALNVVAAAPRRPGGDPLWRLDITDHGGYQGSCCDLLRGGGGSSRAVADSEFLRIVGSILSTYPGRRGGDELLSVANSSSERSEAWRNEDVSVSSQGKHSWRFAQRSLNDDMGVYATRSSEANAVGVLSGIAGEKPDSNSQQTTGHEYPPTSLGDFESEIAGPTPLLDRQPPELPEYGWQEEQQPPGQPHDGNRTAWHIRSQPVVFDDDSSGEAEGIFPRHLQYAHGDDPKNVHGPRKPARASRPVVYQYFGRSLRRSRRADSIPFVVLGPSVDHWRAAGRILSSRGFNVMACQRISGERDAAAGVEGSAEAAAAVAAREGDGEALVLKVMDALRWDRAVVVGCDGEAALAIDAALRLAPERVVGVILCGDLAAAESFVGALRPQALSSSDQPLSYVDSFVQENLQCPCTIIWDGDISSLSLSRGKTPESSRKMKGILDKQRSLIVGGGSSPHRRLPDQFAWVLTRFVEEQVAAHIRDMEEEEYSESDEEYDDESPNTEGRFSGLNAFASGITPQNNFDVTNPFRDGGPIDHFFSSGSFLVTGRYVARMLLYFSIFKVAVHQYHNLKTGISAIQSSVNTLSSWQRRGRDFASSIVSSDWVRKHLSLNLLGRYFGKIHDGKTESSQEPDSSQEQSDETAESQPEEKDETEEPKPSYDDLFYDHRLILIDGVVT